MKQIEAGDFIRCSADPRGSSYALFIGVRDPITFQFKFGYVTQASFMELVTIAVKSGITRVNPRFLFGFIKSEKPVFETETEDTENANNDSETPTELVKLPPDQYSKDNIVKLFVDKTSHLFKNNIQRINKFGKQVIAAKSDLGNVLVYRRRMYGIKADNLLTDQNWMILKDIATGKEFDAFRCSPMTLVYTLASPETIIPDSYKRKWKIWLPCSLLKKSMDDAYAGNLI